jgi:tetratricopeptide (TPR) repeat protein
MQGLRTLWQFQGRLSEWSRLVTEITPDYCTPDDAPIPGRVDEYSFVIEYRVGLAKDHDRDLAQAAALQEKVVACNRQQAASALALSPDAALAPVQHNRIRSLGVSVFTLGQILMELSSPDCVSAYEEAIQHHQRIQNTTSEATSHACLGLAYKDLTAIRNLNVAETAFRRALELRLGNDNANRARDLQSIAMVHHERFNESRQRSEATETVLKHAQVAEQHYLQALALCPSTPLMDLSPLHNQLGILYKNVGQTERAREHYEKNVQICEPTGDHDSAGSTRFNMALMYLQAAERESTLSHQRDLLHRAQAYAQAALRD